MAVLTHYVRLVLFCNILINFTVFAEDVDTCSCGSTMDDESLVYRVVGGSVMTEKGHPSLALLLVDNLFECGGSVISRQYILTAGHCALPRLIEDNFLVVLGVHDRITLDSDHISKHTVQEIIRHEQYNKLDHGVLVNDIALLKVSKIQFTEYIQPICLPFGINLEVFESAVVEGWGTTKWKGTTSRFPQHAVLSVLSTEQCQQTEVHKMMEVASNIDSMVLCAYKLNTDACQGDSGSPMIIRTGNGIVFQIGIVSFGVECGNNNGFPGMYTRVSSYLGWLQHHMQNFTCAPPSKKP